MKKLLFTFLLLLAVVAPAAAQILSRTRTDSESATTRNRIVSQGKFENHADKQPRTDSKPQWGNAAIDSRKSAQLATVSPTTTTSNKNSNPASRLTERTALVIPPAVTTTSPSVRASNLSALTAIYRVGVGDVLDIRLVNMATRESTLFTVLRNGVVEYPLLAQPIGVVGLTTDEIANRLRSQIKVIQNARVGVSVRDYASHSVLITGAVDNPGRKVLRREAMPLYTVMAEALPRTDAGVATISRNGRDEVISLSNSQAMSTLVTSGDVITVSRTPKQFIYVAGEVASFGEKEFRAGMTLTQALISAGAVPRDVNSKAKIARRNPNGFLVTEEYNLQSIRDGKAPDPLLQAGDRIEVRRGM